MKRSSSERCLLNKVKKLATYKKLSCRRKALRCLVLLSIFVSRWRLLWVECGDFHKSRLRPSTKFEVCRPSRSEDTAHLVCQLSIYNSFPVLLFEPLLQKNRHFYVPRPSFFVCPGDAPVAITQNVAQMKRFNACQTPRSMYLSIFNCFRVIRCLSQCVSPKIAIFTTLWFPWGHPGAITQNVA